MVPRRSPLISIVLTGALDKMPEPLTDEAALDVECGTSLNAEVTFIDQSSGLDGNRSTADRET